MVELDKIFGIGRKYKKKLSDAGIENTEDLLRETDSIEHQNNLVEKTGIPSKLISKWSTAADLLRIGEIDPERADILAESGITNMEELAMSEPEQLTKRIKEVLENKNKKNLVSINDVKNWIKSSKKMPVMIFPDYERIEKK